MLKVITGPTGGGKTALAEHLAEKFQFQIFNADAFQFYKEIPILSCQSQNKNVTTQFLGNVSIATPINAGEFSHIMSTYLSDTTSSVPKELGTELKKTKLNQALRLAPSPWPPEKALLVGTGLYLEAALYGLDEKGKKGTPFQGPPQIPFQMVVLNPDRHELYETLNQRVDKMIQQGALEEARSVKELLETQNMSAQNPVLKCIGLHHLLEYLDKKRTWEETVFLWKRDTRRLAKRQWTWLRKFCAPCSFITWMEPDDSLETRAHSFLKSHFTAF